MATRRQTLLRMQGSGSGEVEDTLAVEEALQIVVDGATYAITMRMPGDDLDLVTGFCLTEGVVGSPEELACVELALDSRGGECVLVTLSADHGEAKRPSGARGAQGPSLVHLRRSSCGICGSVLLEEVLRDVPPVLSRLRLGASRLLICKELLEGSQWVFHETGATHGVAIFDGQCQLLSLAEDVGRHNALDKAIGAVARAGRLADARLALVSSRLSFEMVQKAATVGIELLAGFSGATTLAVSLARQQGMTLVGFLGTGHMNLYAHPQRVVWDLDAEART